MIILEKFTSKEVRLEFDDVAFGMLCAANRNLAMQGSWTIVGLFEWIHPDEYESTLKKWSAEHGVDLFAKETYVKGLSPFTSK